jgi:hypothetical protein
MAIDSVLVMKSWPAPAASNPAEPTELSREPNQRLFLAGASESTSGEEEGGAGVSPECRKDQLLIAELDAARFDRDQLLKRLCASHDVNVSLESKLLRLQREHKAEGAMRAKVLSNAGAALVFSKANRAEADRTIQRQLGECAKMNSLLAEVKQCKVELTRSQAAEAEATASAVAATAAATAAEAAWEQRLATATAEWTARLNTMTLDAAVKSELLQSEIRERAAESDWVAAHSRKAKIIELEANLQKCKMQASEATSKHGALLVASNDAAVRAKSHAQNMASAHAAELNGATQRHKAELKACRSENASTISKLRTVIGRLEETEECTLAPAAESTLGALRGSQLPTTRTIEHMADAATTHAKPSAPQHLAEQTPEVVGWKARLNNLEFLLEQSCASATRAEHERSVLAKQRDSTDAILRKLAADLMAATTENAQLQRELDRRQRLQNQHTGDVVSMVKLKADSKRTTASTIAAHGGTICCSAPPVPLRVEVDQMLPGCLSGEGSTRSGRGPQTTSDRRMTPSFALCNGMAGMVFDLKVKLVAAKKLVAQLNARNHSARALALRQKRSAEEKLKAALVAAQLLKDELATERENVARFRNELDPARITLDQTKEQRASFSDRAVRTCNERELLSFRVVELTNVISDLQIKLDRAERHITDLTGLAQFIGCR